MEESDLKRRTEDVTDLQVTEVDLARMARPNRNVVTLGCGVADVMPELPEIPMDKAVQTCHEIAEKIEAIG